MATSEIWQIEKTKVTATITLSSLTNGSGRVSTVIDQSTSPAPRLKVGVKMKSGAAAPTANSTYDVYLVQFDAATSPTIATDGSGVVDAAITVLNARPIGSLTLTASAAATFQGWFNVDDPGNFYAIAIVNSSGQTTDTTAGNHVVEIYPLMPQAQ